jgi:HPt (histidine-containing phosphotransfer) domain-containing protein
VLARGLVETFEAGGLRACAELEAALARHDFSTARRAAHTLVGASANIGAVRLEAVAIALEQAALQQDAVAMRPLVDAARTRLEAALKALKGTLTFNAR